MKDHGEEGEKQVRVAVYCRVSTEREDQANSFESQKRYFKEYIGRTAGWWLYDIYADEGVTGTSTHKRASFLRMMNDAAAHAFDLIVTKEVSRFARNTVDALSHVRELRQLGIGVIFANDGINTLDPDAEFRLAIMASVAQEESRKTSARVKWGQQRRMEAGVVFGHRLLGYDLSGGVLSVNAHEAAIVQRIFNTYVQNGIGTHTIARTLNEEGVLSPGGGAWAATAVLRVLKNEKYCGDLVQKKTFTPDYLTHKKRQNRGEETVVILRDHHTPIISRNLFDAAQRRLKSRKTTPHTRQNAARHPYAGKVMCAVCSRCYIARFKARKSGERYESWRCAEGVKNGIYSALKGCGCPNPMLKTETIDRMVCEAWEAVGADQGDYGEFLEKVTVFSPERIEVRFKGIEKSASFALHKTERGAVPIRL